MNISKRKANKCITHHFACDCREYKMQEMEMALKVIHTLASFDEDARMAIAPHPKALIAKHVIQLCDKALRCLDDKV